MPRKSSVELKRFLSIALLALFSVIARPGFGADPFVGVSGTLFTLGGTPFYYTGTNNYYLGIDPNRSQTEIDEVLNDAKAMGLSVVRTWGFNDGTAGLQTAPGVYNEAVFQKLDYAIAKADELGLKLIIPFVNNWNDYGGMQQYVTWDGGSSHDSFYTDPDTKDWYKAHVDTLLNRINTETGIAYKNDPTIMAWELANEPRCGNASTLETWIENMSAYVKSVDPNHLLTTGVEGMNMADFRRFHLDMPNIDFATMHLYPDYWSMNLEASSQYVDDRIVEANTMLRMPVILEEFGKYRDTGAPPENSEDAVPTGGSGNTTTRDQFYQGLYDVVDENHGAGSNFWILYHDTYPDYDGMGVYYPGDTSTVNIIQTEAADMTAKNAVFKTVPLFDFGTSTQGWAVDWGALSLAHTENYGFPYPVANGALEVIGLDLDGKGAWADGGAVRFLPFQSGEMDFSGEGIERFTAQVFAPDASGSGLKAALYVQTTTSDPNVWDWNEGPWIDLVLGDWTELYLETSGFDMSIMRSFGIHFAVDGTDYSGSVYIDFLATESPIQNSVPDLSAVILLASACVIGLTSRFRIPQR